MKRRSTILIVAGISIAAVISVVAVATHLRLSTIEGDEHGNKIGGYFLQTGREQAFLLCRTIVFYHDCNSFIMIL